MLPSAPQVMLLAKSEWSLPLPGGQLPPPTTKTAHTGAGGPAAGDMAAGLPDKQTKPELL